MAALNQDFVTYQGDSVNPIFTVLNQNNQAVDISTVTEITWTVRPEDLTLPALLTKTKSAGQITFVTSGTDGKFQVAILPADTQTLSGFYLHEAAITDFVGNITTVTVGRMSVGLRPNWTYNPAQIDSDPLFQVRALIGDTLMNDQQLYDQEIKFTLNNYSNVYLAAAVCARMIAAKYARMVDTVQGEIRTMYSERTKRYQQMADGPNGLWQQGMARGGVFAYAGGISVSDKQTQQEDTDRVAPQFTIGEFDNFLPVGPVGHETLDQAASNQSENA